MQFDKRLTQIFLEARGAAGERREKDVIFTVDLFAELVEDSESLLYQYLSQMSPEEEISAQVEELRQSIEKNEAEGQVIPLKFQVINDTKIIEFLVTEQLCAYILAAEELTKSINEKQMSPDDLLMAIIQDPIKSVTKFLRKLNVDIPEFRTDLEEMYLQIYEDNDQEEVTTATSIPAEMIGYLSTFKEDNTILGRDKEIESIWNILLKKRKSNAILVGEPGVGKTAIVQKMVSQINKGTAPEEFKNYSIFSLDVAGMISGTMYRGQAEERFKHLIDFIKNHNNVILFIDEAHLILGAGKVKDSTMDLANALKPLLAGEYSRVIAATTNVEYKYFTIDPAIKRRFEKVEVEEPRIYEVYPMIEARIKNLSEYHKVNISKDMVDFIVLYASCFSAETKNPDRTLDLIDRSMVVAKRKNKKRVDRKDVLSNFKVNMELFKNIPDSDKLATAYHEAGHYIAFSYLPSLRRTVKPVVVSIYPAEGYLGITVTEKRKNVVQPMGKQAYLEHIASYLAGGLAEKTVNPDPNSGVASDSERATELAKYLVTETGFFNDFFYSLNTLETEKSLEVVTKEVKEILKEAKTVADNLILEHRSKIDIVAQALMKKHVVSDEELQQLIKEDEKKSTP